MEEESTGGTPEENRKEKIVECDPMYNLYTEIMFSLCNDAKKSKRRTRSRLLSVVDTYTGSYIFRLHSLFSLSKSREEETSSRIELSADKPAMKHAKAAPPLPFCTESLNLSY